MDAVGGVLAKYATERPHSAMVECAGNVTVAKVKSGNGGVHGRALERVKQCSVMQTRSVPLHRLQPQLPTRWGMLSVDLGDHNKALNYGGFVSVDVDDEWFARKTSHRRVPAFALLYVCVCVFVCL